MRGWWPLSCAQSRTPLRRLGPRASCGRPECSIGRLAGSCCPAGAREPTASTMPASLSYPHNKPRGPMQFRRAHHLTSLLMAALLAIGTSAASRADVLDGVLEVSSAYVKPEQGVFQLF